MDIKTMCLLIEATDDLEKLNDVFVCLNGMGYQEKFSRLDNIYTVIKNASIYKECETEEEDLCFYAIVGELSETPEKRAKILLGVD